MNAPSTRYGGVAIALHWATALLIVANLLLGLSMIQLPLSPRKLQWYLWHKWIGVTVFLLTSLRLAWRMWRPPPSPVPMPEWQRRAAAASHAALYALLLAVPLSGWIYSSASGVQVNYLGLFPLPNLVEKDRALAAALRWLHIGLNTALFALVCVHVGAALRHHFVQRDAVLHRMLPLARPK
jgi:cytochrome b561